MGRRKGRASRGKDAPKAPAARSLTVEDPKSPVVPYAGPTHTSTAPQRDSRSVLSPTTPATPSSSRAFSPNLTTPKPEPPSVPGEWLGALSVFTVVFAVYWRTMQPAVAGGDSGELMTVAHDLGTAHPPGYPLFTMYSKFSELVFMTLSDGRLDAGKAMNLGHTLLSAIAVVFLYFTTTRLTRRLAPGVLAAGLFAFSPAVWTYAVVTEVFALNNFFVSLLLLLCVLFYSAKCRGSSSTSHLLYFSAFVCGLASTNQHTIVLYLLPIVLWAFAMERSNLRLGKFLLCTLLYLLGLSPYLYLIWSATFVKSVQSWGDCGTYTGLKVHLLRQEYGTFHLASKEARLQQDEFWKTTEVYFNDLQTQTLQYGWVLAVVAVLATLVHTVRQRTLQSILNVQVLYLVMYTGYMVFFNALTNFPLDNPLYRGVVQRFWIQPLSLVVLFVAYGFGTIQQLVEQHSTFWHRQSLMPASFGHSHPGVFLTVAVGLSAVQCAIHFEAQDQSANYIVRDFGRAILTGLRNHSILLTKGDLMINSARYVQAMEGYRPDILIVDQEMMTYPWYITNLRHNMPALLFPPNTIQYFPGRPQGFTIRQFLDLNLPHRDVYLCHGWKEGDLSWQGFYDSRPWGIAQQVVVAGTGQRDLRQYMKGTKNLPPRSGLQLPDPAKLHIYPAHSWEWVVRNDYYASIQSHAFFLMQVAERKQERRELTNLPKDVGWTCLLQAIETYRWLFDNHKPEASQLTYRNFGVALQIYLTHMREDLDAVRHVIMTFEAYCNITKRDGVPVPGGHELIEQAVKYWQDYLQTMETARRRAKSW